MELFTIGMKDILGLGLLINMDKYLTGVKVMVDMECAINTKL